MRSFGIVFCIGSLAHARRASLQPRELIAEEAEPAGSNVHLDTTEPVNPCQKATRKPIGGTWRSRAGLDQDQINWLDCEAQKKAELKARATQMDREMARFDNGNTPWGNTFESATKERNAIADARREEKKFEKRIKREQAARLTKAMGAAAVDAVKAPFVSFFRTLASSASSAREAMQRAIYVLLRVPNLTKQQFLRARDEVAAQWPDAKEILLNLIANGHRGGPGVGRATVTPERRAYLNSLRTLEPIAPGPRIQLPGIRENVRRETEECAGYGRLCGEDAGGLGCCSLSGYCVKMKKIGRQAVQSLYVCQ